MMPTRFIGNQTVKWCEQEIPQQTSMKGTPSTISIILPTPNETGSRAMRGLVGKRRWSVQKDMITKANVRTTKSRTASAGGALAAIRLSTLSIFTI